MGELPDILCDEHSGTMARDERRLWYRCSECGRTITDEEIWRLLQGAGQPVPQIVVT